MTESAEKDKNPLTADKCLLTVFSRQIKGKAIDLQFGDMIVKYKVRNGQIKEAHVLHMSEKLRPF